MRTQFVLVSLFAIVLVGAVGFRRPDALHAYWFVLPIVALGIRDMMQRRHAVLRNFPLLGYGRYFLELVRPEINQYFIESNTDGTPFNREQRSLVYQRAKHQLDTLPFGTQLDVYAPGYEWIEHSMSPATTAHDPPRILFGGETCAKPYAAALLNISAMSFGALSKNAVMALNRGAKKGGFFHNTGEGGISPHHLQGGDVVWQIGTGYFGACSQAGVFDAARFRANAERPEVVMIEVKLSQGAKPGHGGILPAAKLTPEIAAIRGVPLGRDVISPPAHSAFRTPVELCEFVARLRDLAGGKPVGIKFCLGHRHELVALCMAMRATGITPDYLNVDGGEGGTGAAPLEFSNSIGTPLVEGLSFTANCLVGFGLRDRVRLIAAGKVVTGFDMARILALGADTVNSARAMMLALGCIQARRCNSNHCPVGVATQDPRLVVGLDPTDKAERVYRFQRETVKSLLEILAAAGLDHPRQLRPSHIQRRISAHEVRRYDELIAFVKPGELLSGDLPPAYAALCRVATKDSFRPISA